MEIAIDLALVRGILAQERKQAGAEIRDLGVAKAYAHSQARHDLRIAAAADVGTLACGAGCSWCCHFSVDVRAVEAFAILDFIEHAFTSEQRTRVYSELHANAAVLKNLDEDARMRSNIKCAFLQEGKCSIYPVRPQTCRNYHATDAAGCRRSYEDPDNLDIDPEFAPLVYQSGGAHVDAFTASLRDAGYDTHVYEMNCALDAALAKPAARQRFAARQPPFDTLQGDEVEGEFDDL